MPLSDALLEPIAGENPSGANLYYDKVFDQIKEARTEDLDVGSVGAWERTAKKADHVLVIKLATEALSKRTKDLRLVGWLIESHLKREGFAVLPPSIELLWKIQDAFWPTFYPEIDDDGDLGLRVTAVEGPVNRIATLLKTLPLTKAGHGASQYTESRKLGYEEAADTSDKRAARQDAIDQGMLTPEDFDAGFASTSKASLVAIETALNASTDLLGEMGVFHEEKYGDDYPGLNKLEAAITEVKQVVAALLYEKRKTDPDPVEEAEPIEEVEEAVEEPEPEPASATVVQPASRATAPAKAAPKAGFSGIPTTAEQAQAAVLAGGDLPAGGSAGVPRVLPCLLRAALWRDASAGPVPCLGLRRGAVHGDAADLAPPGQRKQLERPAGHRFAHSGGALRAHLA